MKELNQNQLGELLKELRAARTRGEAAGLIGVHKQLLFDIESGRQDPSLASLFKILKGYGYKLMVKKDDQNE